MEMFSDANDPGRRRELDLATEESLLKMWTDPVPPQHVLGERAKAAEKENRSKYANSPLNLAPFNPGLGDLSLVIPDLSLVTPEARAKPGAQRPGPAKSQRGDGAGTEDKILSGGQVPRWFEVMEGLLPQVHADLAKKTPAGAPDMGVHLKGATQVVRYHEWLDQFAALEAEDGAA